MSLQIIYMKYCWCACVQSNSHISRRSYIVVFNIVTLAKATPKSSISNKMGQEQLETATEVMNFSISGTRRWLQIVPGVYLGLAQFEKTEHLHAARNKSALGMPVI